MSVRWELFSLLSAPSPPRLQLSVDFTSSIVKGSSQERDSLPRRSCVVLTRREPRKELGFTPLDMQ